MMGIYSLPSYKMKRGRSLSVLATLWSIVLVLQIGFLSSTAALASPRMSMAAPILGASRAVDFADVSVVRVVATYEPPDGHAVSPNAVTLAQCTGLAIVISSWTSVNGDQNNCLLTDGNLVNPNRPSCSSAPLTSNLTLLRVDLYFNTVFNPALLPAFQVPHISVHCQLPNQSASHALVQWRYGKFFGGSTHNCRLEPSAYCTCSGLWCGRE